MDGFLLVNNVNRFEDRHSFYIPRYRFPDISASHSTDKLRQLDNYILQSIGLFKTDNVLNSDFERVYAFYSCQRTGVTIAQPNC